MSSKNNFIYSFNKVHCSSLNCYKIVAEVCHIRGLVIKFGELSNRKIDLFFLDYLTMFLIVRYTDYHPQINK